MTALPSVRRRRSWALPTAGLLVGTAAMLTLVPMPFTGDQALFMVFARALDGGAVLYRDVWDIKQPGIFVYYLVAGRLFGFDEIGVHTLDLLLWLAFAGGLGLALHRVLARAWLAAVAPAALLVVYALVADATEVTQVENVVGPLLFAAAWPALHPPRRRPVLAAFVSGLVGGVVLLFKFVYLPLVAAIWLAAAALRARGGESRRHVATRFVVPAAAGCAVPLVVLATYLVANDLVEIARFTFIEFPLQEAGLAPRPPLRLARSVVGYFVPLAMLVAPAAYRVLVGGRSRGRPLSIVMLVWLALSLPLFLVQPWWSYYLYLGFVPLGVLAVQGLDDALDRLSPRTVWTALIVLALPALGLGVLRAAESVPPLLDGDGIAGLREAASVEYAGANDDVESFPEAHGRAIYVLGDPLILYLAGARQAVPVNGWSPEYWTEEVWDRVTDDLESARPLHLFVSHINADLAADRSPRFLAMVEHSYTAAAETASGTWYRATG